MEQWKTVKIDNEETKYEISNMGRLRNITKLHWKTNGILTPKYNRQNGYMQYTLVQKSKDYYRYAHRLVAEYFIEGDKTLHVNHIDGNKRNNEYINLEWVTPSQNMRHAFDHNLVPTVKPVSQFTLSGKYINTYDSISDASRATNVHISSISSCVLRNHKMAGRFQWRYVDDHEDIQDITEDMAQVNNGVVKLSLDGKFIQEYETITDAYKDLNKIDNGTISQVCKGKRKKYSGFKWVYKNEYYGVDEDIVYSHS